LVVVGIDDRENMVGISVDEGSGKFAVVSGISAPFFPSNSIGWSSKQKRRNFEGIFHHFAWIFDLQYGFFEKSFHYQSKVSIFAP